MKKSKVYLIRFLLIFFALILYSFIITILKTAGIMLGGIPTAILFALLLAFCYAIIKGKIGPKSPKPSKAEENQSPIVSSSPIQRSPNKQITPEADGLHDIIQPDLQKEQEECQQIVASKITEPTETTKKAERDKQVECDHLFHLCPHCGHPSSVDEHCCRCGHRLSPALPVYRLCPDCKRFVPQNQFKCECGYSFAAHEQLLHVCPACGAVLPAEQNNCECGYKFSQPLVVKPRRWPKVANCVLFALLLAVSAYLSLGWYHDHQLLAEASEQLETTQASLKNAKEVNGNLRRRITSIAEEKLDAVNALDFWQKRMVLVTSEGEKYHNYGCFHLEGSELTIYSIRDAKSLGYEPCLDCKPAEREPMKLVPIN